MNDSDCSSLRQLAYRFARHWGCADSDAEDVAQEALLAALAKLQKGPTTLTYGWFYVVTRRLASKRRAHDIRERSRNSQASTVALLPNDHSILVSEIKHLPSLTARDRDLLRGLLDDRSHAQIAAALGWGTKSVGIRVRRLIQKIQKTMMVPPSRPGGKTKTSAGHRRRAIRTPR
jgi:DNA-directed RNA polymerase specialized sigma24 family protein